jgi:hypothetical protein
MQKVDIGFLSFSYGYICMKPTIRQLSESGFSCFVKWILDLIHISGALLLATLCLYLH